MNIDRTLNIYQAYSLAKISALNKQMVIAQYAQCEQISKLEKSLSKELKAINAANQQILENQIKEAKRQEKIRFYRNLAYNIKECINIINGQKDLIFKSFLLKIFLNPLSLYLQDAKTNLEEIGDKEFCSNWEKVLQNNVNQISSVSSQFIVSPFNILLEQYESYKKAADALNKQFLHQEIEKQKIKAPTLKTAKSLNRYQSKGCLITMWIVTAISCFLFIIGLIGGGASDTASLIPVVLFFVIIPSSILYIRIIKSRKKKKNYNSYLASVDKENKIRLQNYNDSIRNTELVYSDLEAQKVQLEHTHPYIKAKTEISNIMPEWHTIVDSIIAKLPRDKNDSENTDFDPLLSEIAKLAVNCNRVSISSIQRRYSIGYNRAKKIVEQLEHIGVIERDSNSSSALAKVIVDVSTLQLILEYNHIE